MDECKKRQKYLNCRAHHRKRNLNMQCFEAFSSYYYSIGDVSKFVDFVGRQIVNIFFPWWSLDLMNTYLHVNVKIIGFYSKEKKNYSWKCIANNVIFFCDVFKNHRRNHLNTEKSFHEDSNSVPNLKWIFNKCNKNVFFFLSKSKVRYKWVHR